MGKFLFLKGKTENDIPKICTAAEYNHLSDEVKMELSKKYDVYKVDNDPPEYDIYNEVAIMGDIATIIRNIDESTKSTTVEWKITQVTEDIQKQRIMNYNHSLIKNHREAFETYLDNCDKRFIYTALDDNRYELCISLKEIKAQYISNNLILPLTIPAFKLVTIKNPDIVGDDIDPKILKEPVCLTLKKPNITSIIKAYDHTVKEAFTSYSNTFEKSFCNNYQEMVDMMKNGTVQ